MLVMDSASMCNKSSDPHSSFRHKHSGYEALDSESEWQESPWHEGLLPVNRPKTPDPVRTISSFQSSQRQISEGYAITSVKTSRTSPITRRHGKSPYKPIRDGNGAVPCQYSDQRKHACPFEVLELRKHVSPFKARREESNHENNDLGGSFRKENQRTPPKFLSSVDKDIQPQLKEVSRMSERSNYSRRSMSVPKLRAREKQQQISSGITAHGAGRSRSPPAQTMMHRRNDDAYMRNPSQYEINEAIANLKLAKSSFSDDVSMQTTESIAPGDIFFSRDCTVIQKNSEMKNINHENKRAPQFETVPEKNDVWQLSRQIGSLNQFSRTPSVSIVLSRTNTSSSSTVSQSSNSRISNDSAKLSDNSGKSSGNFIKFIANKQRDQTDTWFSCVRGRSCMKSTSSPDSRVINEASYIEKAVVVEELRPFWADRHMPRSLSGFLCHKQQRQHIKQLISHYNCPHILFKGPSGAGKKSLCKALLHDIFGDSCWKVSHELRHFYVQDTRPVEIVIPLTSSPHHVELNLKSESKNAKHALMSIIKEIAGSHAVIPEVSDTSFKEDYKVIVLYDVDKVEKSVQHLIKWIIDCYTESCKVILCCEDDTDVLDSVKSRCKLIAVDAPVTHEIMEVLLQIAKKENFELSVSFAARIATKSKQNMRRAIMALEACKANNYPFVDEQPIPLGWEEVLAELALEILADPSLKRLFFARGRLQKLLVEFVHPKLILQKLVEQFLKGIEDGIKRELYYWHAYYNKRLPTGTSALLKLEEFVAKFMSIHRKSTQGSIIV